MQKNGVIMIYMPEYWHNIALQHLFESIIIFWVNLQKERVGLEGFKSRL